MLIIKDSHFVKSIVNIKNRPQPHLPEFAFAGRSNVGKSSAINCILNRHNFARVSKSPGKTQTINYFLINKKFYFVDLPGYGFARVSKTERNSWRDMIENYLIKNPYIKILFVLIDIKVGLKETDIQLMEWLHYYRIPFKIILTKADKLGKSRQLMQKREIGNMLEISNPEHLIIFSSKKHTGRDDILSDIEAQLKA